MDLSSTYFLIRCWLIMFCFQTNMDEAPKTFEFQLWDEKLSFQGSNCLTQCLKKTRRFYPSKPPQSPLWWYRCFTWMPYFSQGGEFQGVGCVFQPRPSWTGINLTFGKKQYNIPSKSRTCTQPCFPARNMNNLSICTCLSGKRTWYIIYTYDS